MIESRVAGLSAMALTQDARSAIRDLARASVEYGLAHGAVMPCPDRDYPEPLRAHGASFVTLRHRGQLLGCIGTLRPYRPLVDDIVHNAFAAAFSDPRFPPLAAAQLPNLECHVAILTGLRPIDARSEADLLAQLCPGIDGLLIEDGDTSATFLPVMWERLPDRRDFLSALQEKAGLPSGYWSDTMRAYRYTVEDV
jgi:AmmeMemoRadiSam system protein A